MYVLSVNIKRIKFFSSEIFKFFSENNLYIAWACFLKIINLKLGESMYVLVLEVYLLNSWIDRVTLLLTFKIIIHVILHTCDLFITKTCPYNIHIFLKLEKLNKKIPIVTQVIDCGYRYSLETPQQGGCDKYWQSVF